LMTSSMCAVMSRFNAAANDIDDYKVDRLVSSKQGDTCIDNCW